MTQNCGPTNIVPFQVPEPGWTEERTATLTSLWARGDSASSIARQIGGVTRNAVIGKANRLGLSSRKRPPSDPNAVYAAGVPKKPRDRQIKINRPRALLVAEPVIMNEADHNPRKIDLLELGKDDCRYPYGDGPFTFCGCPKLPKARFPYCEFHSRVVVQPRGARVQSADGPPPIVRPNYNIATRQAM